MIRFRGERPTYDDSIILIGSRNPPIPEIGYTSVKIPHKPGVITVDKTHNARTIELVFVLNGKDPIKNGELAARLAWWAEGETDGQIIFDEQRDRYYLGILTEISRVDYAAQFPECTLTFTCANPYGFSIDEKSTPIGQSFWYGGDIPAWGTIRYTPTVNRTFAQWSDGERIMRIEAASWTLAAGREYIIDTTNKIVTENGTSIMQRVTLLSDWPRIKRGLNNITGTGGIITWREVYL